eukprot:1089883-Rhodomonas_salina.6
MARYRGALCLCAAADQQAGRREGSGREAGAAGADSVRGGAAGGAVRHVHTRDVLHGLLLPLALLPPHHGLLLLLLLLLLFPPPPPSALSPLLSWPFARGPRPSAYAMPGTELRYLRRWYRLPLSTTSVLSPVPPYAFPSPAVDFLHARLPLHACDPWHRSLVVVRTRLRPSYALPGTNAAYAATRDGITGSVSVPPSLEGGTAAPIVLRTRYALSSTDRAMLLPGEGQSSLAAMAQRAADSPDRVHRAERRYGPPHDHNRSRPPALGPGRGCGVVTRRGVWRAGVPGAAARSGRAHVRQERGHACGDDGWALRGARSVALYMNLALRTRKRRAQRRRCDHHARTCEHAGARSASLALCSARLAGSAVRVWPCLVSRARRSKPSAAQLGQEEAGLGEAASAAGCAGPGA